MASCLCQVRVMVHADSVSVRLHIERGSLCCEREGDTSGFGVVVPQMKRCVCVSGRCTTADSDSPIDYQGNIRFNSLALIWTLIRVI